MKADKKVLQTKMCIRDRDYTRYAMLLYLNKDYAQSSDMAKKGLELAPENHVLKRLAMYDKDVYKRQHLVFDG